VYVSTYIYPRSTDCLCVNSALSLQITICIYACMCVHDISTNFAILCTNSTQSLQITRQRGSTYVYEFNCSCFYYWKQYFRTLDWGSMCSNPCESEVTCFRPESNRGPYGLLFFLSAALSTTELWWQMNHRKSFRTLLNIHIHKLQATVRQLHDCVFIYIYIL